MPPSETDLGESREATIDDVRDFWEQHPLFTGESRYEAGTTDFFEEQRSIIIDDCFAGKLDERIFSRARQSDSILDVGCGPGFWSVELARETDRPIHACDLTEAAVKLARERAKAYNVQLQVSLQNAENMSFESSSFDHINCIGVIHHTPNTKSCVREFHRVLKQGGTALIGVYYKNFVLRNWRCFYPLGKMAAFLGAKFAGRERETIYSVKEIDQLIRMYDGKKNPIGKAYSKNEFIELLEPEFKVESLFVHHFPARTLPIGIPHWLHLYLDRKLGFMIYASVKKADSFGESNEL